MKTTLFDQKIRFKQVKGVGDMELDFNPNQQVYALIGENGVGKTKFLECWFTMLFLSYSKILNKNNSVSPKLFNFHSIQLENNKFPPDNWNRDSYYSIKDNLFLEGYKHNRPVVYLSALNRGNISTNDNSIQQLGDYKQRENNYIEKITNIFRYKNNATNLKTINMDSHIEEWIIQRAQSANPYQAKEDNREIEITTLLKLLHQIDERIDSEFLEISGGNKVFIRIENQKRELSELSSGFSSILKILQSIIAGYSYFTNETQIANVPGVVLIDEIESHLHNQWQVKIIPLLKKLFPNTIFYITTHSSLVISQLEQGEAYRLKREKDGVVYAKLIDNPNKITLVDLIQHAFDINLNQLKIEKTKDQQQAKFALLKLIQQELTELEEK